MRKIILMKSKSRLGSKLLRAFERMDRALGPQHWWPGETAFEVIVGAILTQSTAWSNVEKAIHSLKQSGVLHPEAISKLRLPVLARMIRSSGYFNQKARRLKNFVSFLGRHGPLARLFQKPTEVLRTELLALHGIGPETADSILLYAGGKPVFVVDAYTRRILSRHHWMEAKAGYQETQDLFHRHLPSDAPLFNQYHALLVHVGKNFCKKRRPLCTRCPLEPMLPRRITRARGPLRRRKRASC